MPNLPSERRLHPLSFLFELAAHVRQLVLPGLFVLLAGAGGSERWQIYLMLLFLPYALGSVARALLFRYTLGPEELAIQSGVFVRQERRIPYGRIQNIDAVQTVVHQALKVVEVRLETAGGDEPEGRLTVVSVPAFEELRARVAEARGARAAAEPEGSPATAPALDSGTAAVDLLRLSTRDLVVCGLVQGRGLLVIGALFGLLWQTGVLDWLGGRLFDGATDAERRGLVRAVLRSAFGPDIALIHRVLLAGVALSGFVVITRIFSVGWALVRLHGFALRRAGGDLRTDFGLLTRVAATIPLRRIQNVTVHEGPVHRLFGRVSVHVDTAGGAKGEDVQLQRQWLAPIVLRSELPRLLQEIIPSVPAEAVVWQPVDPRGIRRARVVWLGVAATGSAAFIGPLGWGALGLFAVLALVGELNARKSVRALGWGLTDSGVFFKSGWMWRRETLAPFSKVQAVTMHESPFDRRHGMASVAVDLAGTGQDRHRIHVPYLGSSTAGTLAASLAGHAARTPFRW